jgi:DNA repair protein RecO (recombination protein O)
MPLIRDRCICLRKTEYSETSQIVTLLSRDHGLIRAIAKGAHRRTKAGASKFDGGMDFLELGEAVFTHEPSRELETLTEWTLREGHLELRKDLRAMHLAMYAGELVDKLLEPHDPHPELFDQLEAALPQLGTGRREEAFLVFQLELLRETGYLPEFFACTSCNRPTNGAAPGFFSAGQGGALCRDCESSFPDRLSIEPRLGRIVQTILRPPVDSATPSRPPELTRLQTDPINQVLLAHVQHTLGRPLVMGRWVSK